MRKCRVSVVIPTRNNMADLPKALRSVQAQKFSDMEIIVADDGSTDGTDAFLTAFKRDEPRLRIIETGGKGPGNARNQAISIVRAPLVAFLDADDLWYGGKMKRQVAYLEANPDVGFSFTDYLHVGPDGSTYGTCFAYWQPPYANRPPQGYDLIADAETDLLGCNVCGTSTVVARLKNLEQVNGFTSCLPSAEDWDLWLRLAHEAPVACTSIVTTEYLMRPGSESMRRLDRLAAMSTIIDRYKSNPDPLVKAAVRRAEARILAGKAEIARTEGRYWSAISRELMALVTAPTLRKARTAASDVFHGVRFAFSNQRPAVAPAEDVAKTGSEAA